MPLDLCGEEGSFEGKARVRSEGKGRGLEVIDFSKDQSRRTGGVVTSP